MSRRALFPVQPWLWRAIMGTAGPIERYLFNRNPLTSVFYDLDIDYANDGHPAHRLDVIGPREPVQGAIAGAGLGAAAETPSTAAPISGASLRSGAARPGAASLPVYVYLHGGGWTSGDKATTRKYSAHQAQAGMLVVNVNYRLAGAHVDMADILSDANKAFGWVEANAHRYGADASSVILGGDSAGAQIVALLTAMTTHPELTEHYGVTPGLGRERIAGLVLHCGALDFDDIFASGSIIGDGFVRVLLGEDPRVGVRGRQARRDALRRAARFLSPIEWVGEDFPPALVTTSERDMFYRGSLRFVDRLREVGVPVELLCYDWSARKTEHTWQQQADLPESQEVYRHLRGFVAGLRPGSPAYSAG